MAKAAVLRAVPNFRKVICLTVRLGFEPKSFVEHRTLNHCPFPLFPILGVGGLRLPFRHLIRTNRFAVGFPVKKNQGFLPRCDSETPAVRSITGEGDSVRGLPHFCDEVFLKPLSLPLEISVKQISAFPRCCVHFSLQGFIHVLARRFREFNCPLKVPQYLIA